MSVDAAIRKLDDSDFRRRYGAYDTPQPIVKAMIRSTDIHDFRGLRVLEPACGLAPFSYAISRVKGGWDGIVGVEFDSDIAEAVKKVYPGMEVKVGDYLTMDFCERYDLIIGNPPYGIIGDESHYAISVFKERKRVYKRRFRSWSGKFNIYGLFVEKSLDLLADGGTLCFITPATWMILDEFKKLRRVLSEAGRIRVYYLGGGVFRGLNVVSVILVVKKGLEGYELYDAIGMRTPKLVASKDKYGGEMITFETEFTRRLEERSTTKLGDVFDIKISPRTPEVASSPLLTKVKGDGLKPLLHSMNLKRGGVIDYETPYRGYYIKPEDVERFRRWFLRDRIVVGHTRGGRLVAALEDKHYAWAGDVYHLIPKENIDLRLKDIVEVLNSKSMNHYMWEKYRGITPHTTKTQLTLLPLIPLEDSIMISARI